MRIATIIVILTVSWPVFAQRELITAIDEEGLVDLLSRENDTIYVLNFWATWCSPCVKELPYFEELHKTSTGSKLQVKLINLDFPNQLESRVLPFVEENNITAPVLNMTSLDYNSWIPKVDEEWSGAIPATLVFTNTRRAFIPGEMTRTELFHAIEKITEN